MRKATLAAIMTYRKIHKYIIVDITVQIAFLLGCIGLVTYFVYVPRASSNATASLLWPVVSIGFVVWQLSSAAFWSRLPSETVGRRWIALVTWGVLLGLGFVMYLIANFDPSTLLVDSKLIAFLTMFLAGFVIGQPIWSLTYIIYSIRYMRIVRQKHLHYELMGGFERADILDA